MGGCKGEHDLRGVGDKIEILLQILLQLLLQILDKYLTNTDQIHILGLLPDPISPQLLTRIGL